jgi:alpha-glucosidase
MGDYDKQLHVHDIGHADVHAVNRQMRKLLDSYGTERPRMAMGEIHIFDWPRWASYYGEKLDEYHLPLNFGLMVGDWSAENVRSVVDAVEDALPDGAWPNWVLGNHDEVRVASRVGSEQARVAMLLLLTLRGTPTLYYGDEIGMENVEVPPEKAQDPWGKNLPELGLGRDPFRTPMRWDASENAGFCPEGIEPWLPVGGDLDRINVAAQSQDPGSLLALTRTLIHLRRAVMALSSGDYRPLDEVPQDCFVYERSDGGTRYLIALNFCGERRALHARDFAGARITISTHMDREGRVGAEPFVLRANEGCVLEQGE